MDSYQPFYDAARSKMSFFDGSLLIQEIAGRFDFSHYAEIIKNDALNITYEMQRPAVLFKPKLYVDGNQWCAVYGDDIQNGVAGFGDSPSKAMTDFDNEWVKNLK